MDPNVYGPALPPGFQQSEDSSDCDSTHAYTKAERKDLKSPNVIGPQIPSELLKRKVSEIEVSDEESPSDSNIVGPALPPGFQPSVSADSDSSDSVYGPLPPSNNSEAVDGVVAGIERRAKDMKKKLRGEDKPVENVVKREEWMTTPAIDYKNQLGIISRCLTDDGQSSNKKKPSRTSEEPRRSAKDEQVKEQLDKYNKKKRSESLLEMHKKKKKKRDKESEKPKVRKEFDRDTELGLRFMDNRQVNSVIRNAKKLNSRFSAGTSQYL